MSIDISILGDKELSRKLNRLADKEAKNIARKVIREHVKNVLKPRILQNASALYPERSDPEVKSIKWLAAMRKMKIRQQADRRGLIRIGPVWPSRQEIGIPEGTDKRRWPYWPKAFEYGYARRSRKGGEFVSIPATPYLRPAIDNHIDEDLTRIGKQFGTLLEAVASR